MSQDENTTKNEVNNHAEDSLASLTNGFSNVDLNKFNFNPGAKSFVPSWMK